MAATVNLSYKPAFFGISGFSSYESRFLWS